MKYTDRVMDIVTGVLSQAEQITGQIKVLEANYKAGSISSVDYQAQKEELLAQKSSIRMAAEKNLQEVATAYRNTVEKGSEIDSSMLHDDAKLLQLDGLSMTQKQFDALVEKHKDNTLMIQLLQGYADSHKHLQAGGLPTVSARTAAFSSYVDAARNTMRAPDTMQAAFFQDGKYTPAICTESE